jgi:hypothetical protein
MFTRPSRLLALSTLLAGAVLSATADGVDPQALGPKVGEHVPGFTLADQHGATRSLESTFGPSGVVLVFFRSADW